MIWSVNSNQGLFFFFLNINECYVLQRHCGKHSFTHPHVPYSYYRKLQKRVVVSLLPDTVYLLVVYKLKYIPYHI